MNEQPLIVRSSNLSNAWAEAFCRLMEPGVTSTVPSVLTIDIEHTSCVSEDQSIRRLLDQTLKDFDKSRIETVANTIFPMSLWNKLSDYKDLVLRYRRIFPKLSHHQGNHLGHYFHRMVSYADGVDQLEHIIQTWQQGNHRHSALQVAIFDPTRDHVHSLQRGFPCLHQIAFTPLSKGRLAVQAFYATQYLVTKTYGNVLGLCRLGQFMAQEMSLTLDRVTCIAGRQELGMTKEACKRLHARIRKRRLK